MPKRPLDDVDLSAFSGPSLAGAEREMLEDDTSDCSLLTGECSEDGSLETEGSTETPDLPATDVVFTGLKKKPPKKSVNFDDVTVYYFPRVQGFTCVPSQGGSTLGMGDRHTSMEKYSLTDYASLRQSVHRDILLEHHREGKIILPENFSSDTSTEWTFDEYYFLQPVPARQRRTLLHEAGIAEIDPSERDECRTIRASRGRCGCTCRETCLAPTCACHRAGIRCQVDQMSFPCACSREICANPFGRIEFNAARVRAHFVRTLLQMEMEKGQNVAAPDSSGSAAAVADAVADGQPPLKRVRTESDDVTNSEITDGECSSKVIDSACAEVTVSEQVLGTSDISGAAEGDVEIPLADDREDFEQEFNEYDEGSETSSDTGSIDNEIAGEFSEHDMMVYDGRQSPNDGHFLPDHRSNPGVLHHHGSGGAVIHPDGSFVPVDPSMAMSDLIPSATHHGEVCCAGNNTPPVVPYAVLSSEVKPAYDDYCVHFAAGCIDQTRHNSSPVACSSSLLPASCSSALPFLPPPQFPMPSQLAPLYKYAMQPFSTVPVQNQICLYSVASPSTSLFPTLSEFNKVGIENPPPAGFQVPSFDDGKVETEFPQAVFTCGSVGTSLQNLQQHVEGEVILDTKSCGVADAKNVIKPAPDMISRDVCQVEISGKVAASESVHLHDACAVSDCMTDMLSALIKADVPEVTGSAEAYDSAYENVNEIVSPEDAKFVDADVAFSEVLPDETVVEASNSNLQENTGNISADKVDLVGAPAEIHADKDTSSSIISVNLVGSANEDRDAEVEIMRTEPLDRKDDGLEMEAVPVSESELGDAACECNVAGLTAEAVMSQETIEKDTESKKMELLEDDCSDIVAAETCHDSLTFLPLQPTNDNSLVNDCSMSPLCSSDMPKVELEQHPSGGSTSPAEETTTSLGQRAFEDPASSDINIVTLETDKCDTRVSNVVVEIAESHPNGLNGISRHETLTVGEGFCARDAMMCGAPSRTVERSSISLLPHNDGDLVEQSIAVEKSETDGSPSLQADTVPVRDGLRDELSCDSELKRCAQPTYDILSLSVDRSAENLVETDSNPTDFDVGADNCCEHTGCRHTTDETISVVDYIS